METVAQLLRRKLEQECSHQLTNWPASPELIHFAVVALDSRSPIRSGTGCLGMTFIVGRSPVIPAKAGIRATYPNNCSSG